MNEEIQLKIIQLVDSGATPKNSNDLKALIESSAEAALFYQSVVVSESKLKEYFGGKKASLLDDKIDTFIDMKLEESNKVSSFSFKPVAGFAIAASLAVLALTFIDVPSNVSIDNNSIAGTNFDTQTEIEPDFIVIEESEPLTISGSEMDTLWSTATEMAKELGVDRYEIMYVVYEGNKDSFVDSDINQPRGDKEYFVDLSIIGDLETQFIIDEVKRHIYCRC